jgi:hypothetical protein
MGVMEVKTGHWSCLDCNAKFTTVEDLAVHRFEEHEGKAAPKRRARTKAKRPRAARRRKARAKR